MKILLVNPKNKKGRDYVVIPNIGLGYLGAALKEKNNVEILDCIKENIGPKQFASRIKKNSFDVIGFNLFTPAIPAVKEYARVIKEQNKNIIVVVGGCHPSVEPVETLQILPDVDFGFYGEAEIGFPQLINFLETGRVGQDSLKKVQNLIWRDDGDITCNPKEFIKDLDGIKFPAWELLKPDEYPVGPLGIFSKANKVAPVILTRGCPHRCKFCAASRISGRRIRPRSMQNIMEEIRLLKDEFGIKEIDIMDDAFTENREFARKFCENLIKNDLNIWWACSSGIRVDTLDEELLKLMEASGCYSIGLGIEFGTQKMLDEIKKDLSLQEIEKKIKLIKRVTKIRVTGFFIIGYPGETVADIEKTINFACSLPIDRASFFNFSPFPGSEIYEGLKERGELENFRYDNLWIYSISYNPPGISKKEIKRFLKKAYIKFYLRLKILLGLLSEIKTAAQVKIILKRAKAIIWK